jgi:hypothetical protein
MTVDPGFAHAQYNYGLCLEESREIPLDLAVNAHHLKLNLAPYHR